MNKSISVWNANGKSNTWLGLQYCGGTHCEGSSCYGGLQWIDGTTATNFDEPYFEMYPKASVNKDKMQILAKWNFVCSRQTMVTTPASVAGFWYPAHRRSGMTGSAALNLLSFARSFVHIRKLENNWLILCIIFSYNNAIFCVSSVNIHPYLPEEALVLEHGDMARTCSITRSQNAYHTSM